jgi:hypothetical protein
MDLLQNRFVAGDGKGVGAGNGCTGMTGDSADPPGDPKVTIELKLTDILETFDFSGMEIEIRPREARAVRDSVQPVRIMPVTFRRNPAR